MLDKTKIMQFADGTLEPSEREQVKKEIESNPEYKKLLNDYTYTGDLLNNLGNEIKSLPLPKYLDKKISEFEKNKSKLKIQKQSHLSFFNILYIKYSVIAATFCFVFMGGFFTNQIFFKNQDILQIALPENKTIVETLRSSSLKDSKTFNFYNSFDEKKFNEEINLIANQLKRNQKFEIFISDITKNTFQYSDGFKDKDNNNCKILVSDKKARITSDGFENRFSLTICQNKKIWTLTSINIL